MSTFVLGTDSKATSDTLCDYLETIVSHGDTVHVVHVRTSTNSERIQAGHDAIKVVEKRLNGTIALEKHEFQRGRDPAEELLGTADEVDADAIVIGLRRHSLTQRLMGASTGRAVLTSADRPVTSVPVPA